MRLKKLKRTTVNGASCYIDFIVDVCVLEDADSAYVGSLSFWMQCFSRWGQASSGLWAVRCLIWLERGFRIGIMDQALTFIGEISDMYSAC